MIKAIVTDIEGTTSSLSFVKDVLFPYARQHISEFVHSHAEDPSVVSQLNDVRLAAGKDLDLDGIVAQLIAWIDADKKITPLKTLQGMIWEAGYNNGDFKGHIYKDAYECLQAWHKEGVKLFIYSSGSVYAQKLLFGHTQYGNLNPLFSGYFDTRIGAKSDTQSYTNIIQEIGLNAEDVLFLSDIKAELDAAKEAGLQTCWLMREGSIDGNAHHRQVSQFHDIF